MNCVMLTVDVRCHQSVSQYQSFRLLLVCLPHLSQDRNTWMREAASQNTIDTTNLLFFPFVNPPVKPDAVKTTHGLAVTELYTAEPKTNPACSHPPSGIPTTCRHPRNPTYLQLTKCLLFYVTLMHLFACQCTDDSLYVYTHEFRTVEAQTRVINDMGKNAVSVSSSGRARPSATPSLVPLTITNGSLLPACNVFPFLPACDTAKWP
ncbi:hypothetical protein V8C34DRAFT_292120 [Trichoderma compactum]